MYTSFLLLDFCVCEKERERARENKRERLGLTQGFMPGKHVYYKSILNT
jgi:hypothetical protein